MEIKVIFNFYRVYSMSEKLRRTECKPVNTNVSGSVDLSSTHACCYRNDNFILKSHETSTKSLSNWLYGGKIPKLSTKNESTLIHQAAPPHPRQQLFLEPQLIKIITLGQCLYILKNQQTDTKGKFIVKISKTDVIIFLFW